MQKTLGQISFEIYHRSLNRPCDWNGIPDFVKNAWEDMAITMSHVDYFISKECSHQWVQSNGIKQCTICGKRQITEEVDGGGLGVKDNTG